MYALKPVFDLDAKVEVPTCVYSLPIIQVSQPIAGVGHYSNKQAAPSTPAALEALSARQDAILSRLGQLKNQVSAYKQSIGLPASISTPPQQHPPVWSSPLLLQLARLKETLARVELMFSRPTSSSKQSSKQEDRQLDVSRTADLVIRCSPSSPPLSLPVVCSLLSRAGLSVFTSCHTHSSVSTPLATGLATLLPPGQVARTAARVRITLIWSEVGRDCELMVSPLTQTTIKGEVNLLRYLARLFPNILAYETNRKVQQVDSLLDSVASLVWAVPKARLPLLRSMTSGLTKGGYLAGSELTVADLALYSTLQTMGMDKEMQPDLLNWFKGMGASFGGTKKESKSGKKDAVKQTKSPGKNAESTGDKIKIEKSPAKKSGKENLKPKAPVTNNGGPGKHLGKRELFQYFDKQGIKYVNIDHPEVFTVEAMMPYLKTVDGAICKNLFLKDKKKNLYVLSAVHDKEVNLNDVAKKVGAKDLRFGDESVMLDLLGVTQGCVTAYALVNDSKKTVKFIVDSALLDGSFNSVSFHPMVNTATTQISTSDFAKFLTLTGHVVLKF